MLEDSHGGWCRLRLKLQLSGLAVVHVIGPLTHSVQPHLMELSAILHAHGISTPPIPGNPTTYAQLIQVLSLLGLLSL